LWIDFGRFEADLSDNSITLLPGEKISVQVRSRATLAQLKRAMRLRSLNPS
jgi:beta-mannosidase